MNKIHFKDCAYGFEYGSAEVQRWFSDPKTGVVWIGIRTPKYQDGREIQIKITKSGKVNVFWPDEK